MIRVCFLLIWQVSWATDPLVVKDLRPLWLHYDNGEYLPVNPAALADLHTLYFYVSATAFKGQYLSLNSTEDCNLFVNGQLVFSGRDKRFDIDSLSQLYSKQLFFGVFSSRGFGDLTTRIVSPALSQIISSNEYLSRGPTFFRDYAILISVFLLLFLLILFRTNPQLTLDYFSFAKIFSVQERNENLLASRITSSVNLLFYLFCALLTGFLLSAVFHFAGAHFLVAKSTIISSMAGALWFWLKLSTFILVLLASKLIIVLLSASCQLQPFLSYRHTSGSGVKRIS